MTKPIFNPIGWIANKHVQTMWNTFCGKLGKKLQFSRETFELSDGDFIHIDWYGQDDHRPIVLILHGLGGSSNSPYINDMAQALAAQNFTCAVMHFRGCSGETNRLLRLYHSGDTNDLNEYIHALHKRHPQRAINALGYSLGGNVLLKWLGEQGKNAVVSSAVAISVPFNLELTVEHLKTGFRRIYHRYLLQSLKKNLRRDFLTKSFPFDQSILKKIRTVRDFDEYVTAPLHGFKDAHDYYTKSSCTQFLKGIEKPCLIIQAEDDPFMPAEVIPKQDELSKSITLELSKNGGHVGFIHQPRFLKIEKWLIKRVPEFFLNQYIGV